MLHSIEEISKVDFLKRGGKHGILRGEGYNPHI
jgi:hypothetical protein